jgi:uroporphyrinogen-III decarboxylase
MSDKQFEKFYWPSLKKVILGLINEGLIVSLFAEGSYNTRLETVNEFPRGSVIWRFDKTDMARAKKILGDKCCIAGNVPSSLISKGTPQAIKECCRKLIETCAPGGGYILTSGCSVEKAPPENLQAMSEAGKEYGAYS